MFRTFIIAFEILALVAILRSPFVHYWFGDAQTNLANWMLEISLIAEKKKLGEFKQLISPHIQNLNDYQLEYLNGVISTKNSVNDFNRLYCESDDKNPYIYGASLRYICSEISRTGLLKS